MGSSRSRQGLHRAGSPVCAARHRRGWRGPTSALLGLALGCLIATTAAALERRVVIGEDGRREARESAAGLGVGRGAVEKTFAATGRIECGGVRGIGQLTGRGDTVTSAAHVFFDESGRSRAERGRCVFILGAAQGGGEVALQPDRDRCGSTRPYGTAGHHDWAVARLERPIAGIAPYGLGAAPKIGQAITVIALEGGVRTADLCRVRDVVAGPDGGHEIRTDCTGFDGMSGAAYLTLGPKPRIVGLHVGFRSRHPDSAGAYAEDHHTFGVALDGAFQRTLTAAQ